MRALTQLIEHRRRVGGDKVRITKRLTSALKNYFPQVLQWFQEKDTAIFCHFLSRWPTPKAVQLARRATLETFFRAHHVRYADVIAQRIQAIKAATPLTTDEDVIAPHALLFQALPGAGPVFAPRLLVAFGEQRARYASAAALQKYAGITPVTERSGQQRDKGKAHQAAVLTLAFKWIRILYRCW